MKETNFFLSAFLLCVHVSSSGHTQASAFDTTTWPYDRHRMHSRGAKHSRLPSSMTWPRLRADGLWPSRARASSRTTHLDCAYRYAVYAAESALPHFIDDFFGHMFKKTTFATVTVRIKSKFGRYPLGVPSSRCPLTILESRATFGW